jgi:REP element-mobilizing transposase RayT
MPRPNRHDAPGTWHHAVNRTVAKRTLFESRADCRYFLSLLAREVREGRLEVHAYALMLTHFHLLVKSVKGELSEAMRRIQQGYARYFNRTRKRDGSLFRGRFKSRWIDSVRYRRNVVGYIHDNAVHAGVVGRASQYPWCSAPAHAGSRRGKAPRWLTRNWIRSEVAARGRGDSGADQLESAFPSSITEEHRQWIERQLRDRHDEEMEEVSLKHAASPRVVRWAIRKAKLADGTRPWRPVCPAQLVERIVAQSRAALRILARLFPQKLRRATALLRAGLLRMLSGCTHREIALRTKRHRGTVAHDLADHRERIDAEPAYADLTAPLARKALAAIGV